jgi:hypothetical protein
MRRALPFVVISVALATQPACFPERWSARGHTAAYVADGAAALLGGALLLSHCPPPPNDLSCDLPPQEAGAFVVGGAVVGALINLFLAR